MMWHAVYDNSTGALLSQGATLPDGYEADFAQRGLAVRSYDARPLGSDWNAATRDFDIPQAAPARVVTPLDFLNLFSDAERLGIRAAAKTDIIVDDVLDQIRLAQEVDLTSPRTAGALDVLIAKSLLTAERKAEILNGH